MKLLILDYDGVIAVAPDAHGQHILDKINFWTQNGITVAIASQNGRLVYRGHVLRKVVHHVEAEYPFDIVWMDKKSSIQTKAQLLTKHKVDLVKDVLCKFDMLEDTLWDVSNSKVAFLDDNSDYCSGVQSEFPSIQVKHVTGGQLQTCDFDWIDDIFGLRVDESKLRALEDIL